MNGPRVIIVAGPTASGKSVFALEEALSRQGAIINADSLQLYEGLPLLTAQPRAKDRQKVPHFLYEIFSPFAPQASASQWQERAVAVMRQILDQNKIPWIVGGTGFYLRALTEGLSPMPSIPEDVKQKFKEKTQQQSTPLLFNQLKREDPLMAGRLSPTDRQRILRALSVWEATGKSLAFWQTQPRQKTAFSFEKIYLSPPRATLRNHIEARLQTMLKQGVIEEVEAFLKKENALSSPLAAAIGFSQIADFLQGKLSREEALEKIIFETRQYAKRQETWFRHQFSPDFIVSEARDVAAWRQTPRLYHAKG